MIAKAHSLPGRPLWKPARVFLMLMVLTGLFPAGVVAGETAPRPGSAVGAQIRLPEDESVSIKDITFRIEEAKEVILITLNRFYVPEISRIEGEKPRVVMDFRPVTHFRQKDYSKIAVNGHYVRQMRSYHDRQGKRLRIVLDMNGSLNYFAQPSFTKSKNLFQLEITEAASNK